MEKKKNKIFEYLEWRGDLDFDASPFNEVDAGILCLLSYLDYTGLISKDFSGDTLSLEKISSLYFGRNLPYDLRVLDLLNVCAKTKRFSSVLVCGLFEELDAKAEKQFCGLTFLLPIKKKQAIVVFRGTDVTLVGWKEDFNMTFTYPIPCQEEALKYLEKATSCLHGFNIVLAGHSKGGNAAIYASNLCSKKAYNSLSCIYTFDSPGFDKKLVDTSIFLRSVNKVKAFVPKDSIIGMLMEFPCSFKVVESDAFGFMQHDIFSWEVKCSNFVQRDSLTNFSINAKRIMTKWLESLDMNHRQKIVEVLFNILAECGINEVADFEKKSFSTVVTALKLFTGLDSVSKEYVLKALGLFFKAAYEKNDVGDI